MDIKKELQSSTVSTFIVMGSTLISRILGFVRTAIISSVFGASGTADVINLTFAIPNNLRKLMAEGALSSAFIPVLSETISIDQREKSNLTNRLFQNLITLQVVIIVPLSLLGIIFAEPLITNVLTQFNSPEKISMAVSLFRYFINYLLFISISAVIMGLLNSNGYFFVSSVTPLLFSVSVISSILILNKSIGIYSMVFGVLLGGILQILFQLPLLYKLNYKLNFNFDFNNVYFKRIMKQWLPVVLTASLFTITQQIAFYFSSGLEEGSTSALINALVFWQLPFGIFSASITTVLFPKFSRLSYLQDTEGLKNTLNYGIRLLFSLLLPSALLYLFFGKLIIATALQRGLFNSHNTNLTYKVLSAYSLGLFSVGGFNFLQRYFYSRKNFKIPFFASLLVCSIDIILSFILKETRLRVTGLAAANSISFTIGFILLLFYSRKTLNSINGLKLLISFSKILLSMVPVIIVSIPISHLIKDNWQKGGTLYNLFTIIVISILWGIIILGMYKITKVEIIDFLLSKRNKNDKQ